jgi:hypothetical protein
MDSPEYLSLIIPGRKKMVIFVIKARLGAFALTLPKL